MFLADSYCYGRLVGPINEFISLFLTIATILVYLHPLLNPLLYLWRMKDICNDVKQLVKKILPQSLNLGIDTNYDDNGTENAPELKLQRDEIQ